MPDRRQRRTPPKNPTKTLWTVDLFGLHRKADRRSLFVLQLEFYEGRFGVQVQAIGFDIAPGDGDRLDGLIDGMRADRLNLDLTLVAQQSSDGASDGIGP